MSLIETHAIVVKLIPFRESDRIAWLVTRERGLVSAVVPGARRSHKRFANVFDLANCVTLKLNMPRRGMARADSGKLVDGYWALSQSSLGLCAATHVIELLRRFSVEEHEDAELFDVGVGALRALARDGVQPRLLRIFEGRLLGAVGLAPNLESCIACGRDIPADRDARYSFARSGVVCDRCVPGRDLFRLGAGARAALARVLEAPIGTLYDLPMDKAEVDGLTALLPRQIEHHLGGPLVALRFARSLVKPDQWSAPPPDDPAEHDAKEGEALDASGESGDSERP
ncbi:DNA repair protein RecO [bacterium]|nr:DNA repair protein RecO [bacterium]